MRELFIGATARSGNSVITPWVLCEELGEIKTHDDVFYIVLLCLRALLHRSEHFLVQRFVPI